MKNVKKLKNLYTGEIVLTESYHDVNKVSGLEFIMVYKESNPERKYLVNRLAFEVLTK